MLSHEQRLVITNVFHRLGWALAVAAAWAVGVFLGCFVELLIDHRVDSFLVSLQGIPGVLPPVFTMILLGYFLITAYDDFKWTIQNGISRKTLWWGRLIALVLATLGIWVVNNLLSLFEHPLASWQVMGMQLLALLSGVLILQMIGNGFGLLNRTWKWIGGIGLPILFILFLVALVRVMMSLNIDYQHNEWNGSVLVVLFGRSLVLPAPGGSFGESPWLSSSSFPSSSTIKCN